MNERMALVRKIALVALSTAVYGAILALWRSPLMAVYVAVKLPFVFIASTFIVSFFCWVTALLLGADLRYREVVDAVFLAMATAGKILLALAPIVLFFILSGAPDTGTRDELRFAHAALMLVHVLVFAVAGTLGVVLLGRRLAVRLPAAVNRKLLLALWLGTFSIVGCQLGWMMRPLVGSPNIVVEFLREDALASNFLESMFNQIIPHFIHKGALR